MPWRYPADDRHVPAGGGFLSTVLDNGQPRILPHSGLDYSHWEGSPVFVIGPGVVVARGSNDSVGWGNYVYVDHGDIGDGSGRHLYSYYAHMQNDPPAVGTRFNGGERIGSIGRTGSGITGAHLHWGTALATPAQFTSIVLPMGSAARSLLVNPENEVAKRLDPLEPNERLVASAGARRRDVPSLAGLYDGNANFPGGTQVRPEGWVKGEAVLGTDVWFRIGGLYSHASGFTDGGTHDIAEWSPGKRTVRSDITNARIRASASTAAHQLATIDPGTVVDVRAYAKGEGVTQSGVTSDVWFKVGDGFSWAGSFTSQSIESLTLIDDTPLPEPNELDPSKYTNVTPDSSLAKWIGSPNYGKRDPLPKDHITLHWMAGRLPGTDATFQIPGEITAEGLGLGVATTYGIGHETSGVLSVHQYVREDEYHHGDGDAASNASGISIEHEGGYDLPDGSLAPVPEDVIQKSIELLVDIAVRRGWSVLVFGTNVKEHRDYVQTTCPGTLPSGRIAAEANARLQLILHPDEPPPDPEPEPEPNPDDTPGWFKRFLEAIVEAIKKFLGIGSA